jgi:Protein of unknown function (DUF3987)
MSDWPELDGAAFIGPAGDYASFSSPHTEADPVAVLVTTLVMAGTAIGPGPFVQAGNDRHSCCLFATIVGATAKGAKGTSYAASRACCHLAFSDLDNITKGGFGSGETIIDMLADGKRNDSRLLIFEREFSRFLAVARRDGSIASQVVRDAWDGARLENHSRSNGHVVASEHHIGFVGHITADELTAKLSDAEVFSGFANRFLWVVARRHRFLPAGGNVPESICVEHARELRRAVVDGRKRGEMKRTEEGEKRWYELCERLAEDEPNGLLGAAVARDRAQCLRLSLLYTLLDRKPAIDVPHIDAAAALWDYCRASAQTIFGETLGDPVADRLLEALKVASPAGLDFNQQVDLFQRHVGKTQLDATRALLESKGLIITVEEPTGGRPRKVSKYVSAR